MIAVLTVLLIAVSVLTIHAVVNAAQLHRPPSMAASSERVAVLLPVRDEAHRVTPCLHALLGLDGNPRIIVLDDGSTDGTRELVERAGVTVLSGSSLPPGWLGKPHACQQLADGAGDAEILVFVDADVILAPDAVGRAVALLESISVDLLSPYPRIDANGLGERLVQPLLQWSWLTFLPLRAMERLRNPSLAAAGGQFLVVRAAAYRRAGGHAAVRGDVLEDIALARAIKRSGGRIALADGSELGTCRMYTSWRELIEGYSKSLWASFGSPVIATLVTLTLLGLYVAPIALAPFGWWLGLAAYLVAVFGRVVSARATGGRALPDAFGHPASILVFAWLLVRSYRRRRTTRWKGRATWPASS